MPRFALVTFMAAALALCQAAGAQAPKAERMAFDIPSQPLSNALAVFGRQAGLQVLRRESGPAGNDSSTPEVRGELSVEEALKKLLATSGLRYEFVDDRTVRISDVTPVSRTSTGMPPASVQVAQETSPSNDDGTKDEAAQLSDAKGEELSEIVVTGTHIRGAQPTSPRIEIDSNYIERSGYSTAAEVIGSVPQNFGGGYNANVVAAGGTSAQANYSSSTAPNLRGLGGESTLTLVNGRRLAYSDTQSVVDVSLIPVAAIDRIDIVTDGASAIYGSDAVAGVVNFILKRDYDGVEARGAIGHSSRGGGKQELLGALGGTVWSGGGGIISYEHATQDPILARQRSFANPGANETYLIPTSSRNSFFGNVHQQIGPSLELSAQGLYTRREAESVSDIGLALPGYRSVISPEVEQFAASVGADIALSPAWKVSLSGSLGRNSDNAPQVATLSGAPYSADEQQFKTSLDQVDAIANGRIADTENILVSTALGASYRREGMEALQFNEFIVYTDDDENRTVRSAYAETSARVQLGSSRDMVISVAGRADDYDEFGTEFLPKLGITVNAFRDFSLRGSWGKSFRAPSLSQQFAPDTTLLYLSSDSQSATGGSIIVTRTGDGERLTPERSTTASIGTTWHPSGLDGFRADLNYYQIRYSGRIQNVYGLSNAPLNDPFLVSFVERDPIDSEVASLVANTAFFNYLGAPFDPSAVVAIFDGRFANAAKQKINGLDALATYSYKTSAGEVTLTGNIAYIRLHERILATTPERELTGTLYNPPKFRARAGASWTNDGLSASGFLNYGGRSSDLTVTPLQRVDPTTTVDVQLAYEFDGASVFKQLRLSLSAQNLFDEAPPRVNSLYDFYPGLGYDSTNASAIGRFVTFQVVSKW